ATRRSDGLDVAIKFLSKLDGDTALRRFLREATILSAIQHPNVVHVLEHHLMDGHPYMVSELVDGGTLAEKLSDRLPLRVSVTIAIQCLQGLGACHAKGIVHRDVKPSNILFTRS